MSDLIALHDGRILTTHGEGECAGEWCCIKPSTHRLSRAPLNWRSDRRLMERMCPHGVGHPDPDGLEAMDSAVLWAEWLHGCDGCCGIGVDRETGTVSRG